MFEEAHKKEISDIIHQVEERMEETYRESVIVTTNDVFRLTGELEERGLLTKYAESQLKELYVRYGKLIGPIQVKTSENPCSIEENKSWLEENKNKFANSVYDRKWLAIVEKKIVAAADDAVLFHKMVDHFKQKIPTYIIYYNSVVSCSNQEEQSMWLASER